MQFILFLGIVLLKIVLTKVFTLILVMLNTLVMGKTSFFQQLFYIKYFKYYLSFLYLGANLGACLVSYALFKEIALANAELMAVLLYILSLLLTLIRYKLHVGKLNLSQDKNENK